MDVSLPSLLGDVAPDGDGYGLAIGGWLDDARYAQVTAALYARSGVTRDTLAGVARRRVRRREIAEKVLVSAAPPAQRRELLHEIASARSALEITETHGPLMHAFYLHSLRNLVIWQAAGHANALPRPTDIAHLSIAELDPDRFPRQSEIIGRRQKFDVACAAPLPPAQLRSTQDGTELVSHPTPSVGGRECPGTWRGVPGAPGLAEGLLVIVRRPSEIEHVTARDVVLVPDPGAVWGWLGPGVRALLVEDGQQLSHLATASRELGLPCVLNCAGLAAVVPEGRTVRVDGRRGSVSW